MRKVKDEAKQQHGEGEAEDEGEDEDEDDEEKGGEAEEEEEEKQNVEFYLGATEQDDPPQKDTYFFNETSKNKFNLGNDVLECPVHFVDLVECADRLFTTLKLGKFNEKDFALGRILPFNGTPTSKSKAKRKEMKQVAILDIKYMFESLKMHVRLDLILGCMLVNRNIVHLNLTPLQFEHQLFFDFWHYQESENNHP